MTNLIPSRPTLLRGQLPMLLALLGLLSFTLLAGCKKEDDKSNPPPGGGGNGAGARMLVITTGPQSLKPDQSVTYQAQFVFDGGRVEPATGVRWSVEGSSDVAQINASTGALSVKGAGVAYVKATYDAGGGNVLTALAPVRVVITSLFTVAPWAITCEPGFDLQFEVFAFGVSGRPTVSYSSSNTSVCTVDANGNFKATGGGTATITVTARTNDGEQTQEVPVLVVGAPNVPLPVTSVRVSPAASALFRGDQLQLTARAFNGSGNEVSETFTWTSLDPQVATVNSSGRVTAIDLGEVTIQAQTRGVIGQAVIEVQPDTIVIITPFSTSVTAGGSKTFNATVWSARNDREITSHAPLQWFTPSFPGFDFLNVGTLTASGDLNKRATLQVSSNALPGIASFVMAQVGNDEDAVGAASVQVAVGTNDDCGAGNPDVASINITNGRNITLNLLTGGNHQIAFEALDDFGVPVSNPAIVFNSDNIQVAYVDTGGNIVAAGEGTATITLCSGSYASTTVTVTVTLFKRAQP